MATKKRLPHERGIRARTRLNGITSYQFRWEDKERDGSITKHSETFAGLEEAIAFREKIERKKRENSYNTPSRTTVSEVVTESIDRIAAAGDLSHRSVQTYRQRQRTMIDPLIGRERLHTLKPIDVQRWIDRLRNAGFAPCTINSAFGVLRAALKEASALRSIDHDPSTAIRCPNTRRREIVTWTPDEVQRVFKVIEHDEIFGVLTYTAIATGMRPAELTALKWRDVDLDKGTILVRATVSRDKNGQAVIVNRTKSKRERQIAITPHTIERLKWQRVQQRKRQIAHTNWQDMGLVFDRGDGHWIHSDAWYKARTRIAKASGVKQIRAHDYRHTSFTLELAAGTNPKIVAERAGHSTTRITLDLYSHVSSDLQREAADRFSRLFLEGNDDEVKRS